MLKLAFVVHRYGPDIIGGSEKLSRSLAQRLSKYFEITVLTTCAEDYMTWENSYNPGESQDGPVIVRRFRTDHPRIVADFNKLSEAVYRSSHETSLEEEWMRSQGPYSSDFIDYISRKKSDYDLFVFFTYLYATTYYGIQKVSNRSVLVPTAHDEPPIYLGIFGKVFEKATGIVYQSPEERAFAESRFDVTGIPSAVLGIGFDPPEPHGESEMTIDYPFVVYVGRLDESKGCAELIEYFRRYKNERKTDIKLLLVGPNIMNAKPSEDILITGVLPDQQKSEVIRRALFLVMPSRFESFSISIFEAWLESRPVLVNASSEVMKGHSIRSNGGLYYSNYEEFKLCLDELVTNKSLRDTLGSQGRKYVLSNYSWPRVEEEYRKFLTQIAGKVSGLTESEITTKVAFVIPWYGADLTGGAETLCRTTAEELRKRGVAVEVLTTCSKQFLSDWTNNYSPGVTQINGVTVRRFSVNQRDRGAFDAINHKLLNGIRISSDEEIDFIRNNINSSTLYDYVSEHLEDYIFIFMPYLYGTTYYGSLAAGKRSILVPCLHDESYAHLDIFREMFCRASRCIFNSEQEALLARQLYPCIGGNYTVAGVGINPNIQYDKARFLDRIPQPFLLYVGRKDPTKNTDLLVDYYCRYIESHGNGLRLVLNGAGGVEIPLKHKDTILDTFLSQSDKFDAYASALATCQPSVHESFSIVIMESWLCGTPVLVNGDCAVTREHCMRSNGGLWFTTYEEFEECVDILLRDTKLATRMGENGRRYVLKNYGWDTVTRRYIDCIRKVCKQIAVQGS